MGAGVSQPCFSRKSALFSFQRGTSLLRRKRTNSTTRGRAAHHGEVTICVPQTLKAFHNEVGHDHQIQAACLVKRFQRLCPVAHSFPGVRCATSGCGIERLRRSLSQFTTNPSTTDNCP